MNACGPSCAEPPTLACPARDNCGRGVTMQQRVEVEWFAHACFELPDMLLDLVRTSFIHLWLTTCQPSIVAGCSCCFLSLWVLLLPVVSLLAVLARPAMLLAPSRSPGVVLRTSGLRMRHAMALCLCMPPKPKPSRKPLT